jgi:hypothetical protein
MALHSATQGTRPLAPHGIKVFWAVYSLAVSLVLLLARRHIAAFYVLEVNVGEFCKDNR